MSLFDKIIYGIICISSKVMIDLKIVSYVMNLYKHIYSIDTHELYNIIHFDKRLNIMYCGCISLSSTHILINHKTGKTHDSSLIIILTFKSVFEATSFTIYFNNRIILTWHNNYIMKLYFIDKEYIYKRMIHYCSLSLLNTSIIINSIKKLSNKISNNAHIIVIRCFIEPEFNCD